MRDLLLLLETSGTTSSVALAQRTGDAWEVLAEVPQAGDAPQPIMRHVEQLLPLIKQVLPPDGWERLAAVATSSGPGSYTALRAGLSSAKGICLAQDIPLLQASTMRGLAPKPTDGTPNTTPGGRILTLLPARRNEVYAAVYEGPELRETMEPTVVENDAAWREAILSTGILTVCAPEKGLLIGFDEGPATCLEVERKAVNLLWECQVRIAEKGYDDLASTVPLYVRPPYITQAKTRL